MMKTMGVLLLWMFCFSALSEEDKTAFAQLKIAANCQTPEAKMYEAAQIYTRTCVSEKERKDWTAKWESRLQDTVKGDVTEDAFVRDFAFNWCVDHKSEFKEPEKAERKNVIFFCMLVIYIKDKDIGLPSKVREKLTPEVADKVVDFLLNKAPKLTDGKPAGWAPD